MSVREAVTVLVVLLLLIDSSPQFCNDIHHDFQTPPIPTHWKSYLSLIDSALVLGTRENWHVSHQPCDTIPNLTVFFGTRAVEVHIRNMEACLHGTGQPNSR